MLPCVKNAIYIYCISNSENVDDCFKLDDCKIKLIKKITIVNSRYP